MTTLKRTYALLVLAFAFITGMVVVTVVTQMEEAIAFTTFISHEDQSVGGCSGSGC